MAIAPRTRLGAARASAYASASWQTRAARPTTWCANEDAEPPLARRPYRVEPARERFARMCAHAAVDDLRNRKPGKRAVGVNLWVDGGQKRERARLATASRLVLDVVDDQPVRREHRSRAIC